VGAALALDGRGVGPSDGFFLGPTIFDRVTPDMTLWRDELFGPILSVVRAGDLDDALKVMNASRYGNAASIFTTSGGHAREFKRRAEAGMLGRSEERRVGKECRKRGGGDESNKSKWGSGVM